MFILPITLYTILEYYNSIIYNTYFDSIIVKSYNLDTDFVNVFSKQYRKFTTYGYFNIIRSVYIYLL